MTEAQLVDLIKEGFAIYCGPKTVFSKQRGPTCGLYTIQNAQEGFKLPISFPATKESSEEDKTSLRAIAKKEKLSILGEVYDVNGFKILATLAKLNAEVVLITDFKHFLKIIIEALGANCFIAVPLSNAILKKEGTPGDNPHWVLVIGIKMDDSPEKMEVCITTWGKIYRTGIVELFFANQTISDRPKRYKKKIGPLEYKECKKTDLGAIEIPEYKASQTLAKHVVILSKL